MLGTTSPPSLSRRRGGLFSIRLSRRCGGLFCTALIPPTWRIACPVFLVWISHLRLAASGSWTSFLARPVDEPPIFLLLLLSFRVGICDFRLVVSGSWRLARWNRDEANEAILAETLFGMGVGSATTKTMSSPLAGYRSAVTGEARLAQAERGTSRLSLTKKHAWRQPSRR